LMLMRLCVLMMMMLLLPLCLLMLLHNPPGRHLNHLRHYYWRLEAFFFFKKIGMIRSIRVDHTDFFKWILN
jgi:hypothetical protein